MSNHHVVEWQRALGLRPTGLFDPDTLEASLRVLAASKAVPREPDGEPPTTEREPRVNVA